MKKVLLTLLSVSALSFAINAESPRWLRNTAISPDGNTVLFTFKGDIYSVNSSGGQAVRLTVNPAYDTAPVWSPDGKTIAFMSYRDGSADIFTMPSTGGTPVKITTSSGSEAPIAFIDNSTLLYSTTDMPSVKTSRGFMPQTYTVDVTKPSPRPKLYASIPMKQASVNSRGQLLYADKKGVENIWRKHERSSGTSDIWLMDGGKFTKLTDFAGHDLNPVWTPDASGFYFLSEADGTLNVWKRNIENSVNTQLTNFTEHPVRSLSASADGVLAFSYDGDVYTLRPGGRPEKLDISITTDLYDSDNVKSTPTSGATNIAVSPDGKEVAFTIRGDIYVTDTKYETTRRITDTPWQERNVSFSPDGKTLVYDSDRNGYWQLFTANVISPDGERFAYADEIREQPLYSCATSAQQPVFSPDGSKIAFLENRDEIRVIDVATKSVTTALDGKYNYSYTDGDITFAWSPDSRWLVADFFTEGGWNNKDIALVKADGSEVINLTESGYSNANPKWALGGKAVTFDTGKYGMKNHGSWGNQDDIILMVLDPEAWEDFNMTEEEASRKEDAAKEAEKDSKESSDKKSKKKSGDDRPEVAPLIFDIANRHYRTARLTSGSALTGDYFLSPKGDKLYYVARATEGGYNLLQHDLRDGATTVLVKKVSGSLIPDAKGENLFVGNGETIRKINLEKAEVSDVKFRADFDRKPSAERAYIYDHVIRQVNDKFYDKNLHGVDWQRYALHYRQFLPFIDNNFDFTIMLSELLGELNASHTGSGYRTGGAAYPTANLGAFYSADHNGDGLLVEEVLPRSPLSAKDVRIRKGDIILAVDGTDIKAGTDYFPLMEGKAGKVTRLKVRRANGVTEHVNVKPVSAQQRSEMLYQRWVERNERYVDSVSGGRVGYVHVAGMNNDSFRTAYDRILGKYRNCDAIVVDTRHNGGGWLHNDLAILLSGKEYARFAPRGKYIGSEPWSQWHKPSAMLIDESNYSDAHGSPYTYHTLGIGTLVGAPVPGTMTAVWWEDQIDRSIYFGIPQVATTDLSGRPLENVQLNPDIEVYNNPADELDGFDAQLDAAVHHLLDKTK